MGDLHRNGKIGLRIGSDTAPLRDLAPEVALTIVIIHDRGEHYLSRKGRLSEKPARQNYVCFDIGPVMTVAQANAEIARALSALQGTRLAAALASDEASGQLIVAAFQGEIDWEGGLLPDLVAEAKAMHLQVGIEHYDRFTDEGAPLWVRI